MKKLVIEVLTTDWCKLLRIKKQTHRGIDFNDTSIKFTALNGFSLLSNNYPQINCNMLYVRGDELIKDNLTMVIPSEEWLNRLRFAVKEYNNTFSDKCKEDIKNIEVIK